MKRILENGNFVPVICSRGMCFSYQNYGGEANNESGSPYAVDTTTTGPSSSVGNYTAGSSGAQQASIISSILGAGSQLGTTLIGSDTQKTIASDNLQAAALNAQKTL